MEDEIKLLEDLKKGDRDAYKMFFDTYNKDMMLLAYLLLRDRAKAYTLVYELFEKLYQTQEVNKITLPIQAHLNAKVREKCGF